MICVEDLVRQRAFATPHGQALLDELVDGALALWNGRQRLAA